MRRGSFEVGEPGWRLKGRGGEEVESGVNKREKQYNSPVRIGAPGNRVRKSFKMNVWQSVLPAMLFSDITPTCMPPIFSKKYNGLG